MRYSDPASAPPTAHERSILSNPPTRHAAGEQSVTDDPLVGTSASYGTTMMASAKSAQTVRAQIEACCVAVGGLICCPSEEKLAGTPSINCPRPMIRRHGLVPC